MSGAPNDNEDPDTEGTTVPPYEGRRKAAVDGPEEPAVDGPGGAHAAPADEPGEDRAEDQP